MSKLGVKIWRYIFESGDEKRIAQQHPDISMLELEKDIPYVDDNERGHLFDIYRRKDGNKSDPVMINIHGGGLFASYKEVNAHFNYEIAKLGYTVVSLSYRRIPETTMWHQVDDIMKALRYIDENAEKLRLNRERVFISGDSAGALLSLFALSLTNSQKLCEDFGVKGNSLDFKAGCFISIMLDTQRKDLLRALSNVVTDKNDKGREYEKFLLNPSLLIDQTKLPEIIQFTSEEDLIQKDSLKLHQLFNERNTQHEFHNYPKGTDNKLVHVFSVMYPDYQESREVYSLMDKFFKEHEKTN